MDQEMNFLPAFLIADFYKNSLVEIPDFEILPTELIMQEEPTELRLSVDNEDHKPTYLGNNHKQVVILLHEPDYEFINEADLQFLTNILSACQLTISDIAIFNLVNQQVIFNGLKENMNAKHFLLFGIEPTEIKLPFVIPQFQVQQYAGCTILIAPPLHQMNAGTEESKSLKRELWTSLQLCFNLKTSGKK